MDMLKTTSLIFYHNMALELSYFSKVCLEVEVYFKSKEEDSNRLAQDRRHSSLFRFFDLVVHVNLFHGFSEKY